MGAASEDQTGKSTYCPPPGIRDTGVTYFNVVASCPMREKQRTVARA
jgi:hypothetical protein